MIRSEELERQRKWAWEIHKNCDQLLHQRLASFTAAQAMTLASFTVLTVARFRADPSKIPLERIDLLDIARVVVVIFGIFLAVAGYLVTYPMLKRLRFLNDRFFFKYDSIYKDYFDCIEWNPETWTPVTESWRTRLGWTRFAFYRNIIPIYLPLAETAFWVVLLVLLLIGIRASSQSQPGAGTNFRTCWPSLSLAELYLPPSRTLSQFDPPRPKDTPASFADISGTSGPTLIRRTPHERRLPP